MKQNWKSRSKPIFMVSDFFLNKGAKIIQWQRDIIFLTQSKVNPKCVINWNVNGKTIKLIEENKNFMTLGWAKSSLIQQWYIEEKNW